MVPSAHVSVTPLEIYSELLTNNLSNNKKWYYVYLIKVYK